MLNKLANVINEKATSVLYNLLEGLYEYDLPEPGETATVFSHDGQDQIQFVCPDRRNVPSINENVRIEFFISILFFNHQILVSEEFIEIFCILRFKQIAENIHSIAA